MDFKMKCTNNLHRGCVVVYCSYQDHEYMKELLTYLQTHDIRISAYDDEHNMFMLPLALIYYIENIDGKSFLYTKKEAYRSYQRFSVLKKMYQKIGFRQINKNTIVNLHYIQTIRVSSDCRRTITLKNGEQLIVNRSFRHFMEEARNGNR